ncbi:MAG: DUF5666 domain-containing protein [Pseudomonadota bacterium]|nr:DUF5666 domain-containing protein [Pseudomonadota bacterium]
MNGRSFATGAITGFGSVIVNGVRFDDSVAAVADDDGNVGRSTDLKLGMTLEIHGDAIADDATGSHSIARAIVFGAALLGPVSAVDAATKTLVVLGQTVHVLDTTVLDDRLVGGFAGIAVGSVLEIHGQLEATTGAYSASRAGPSLAAAGFKIRGIVGSLDSVAKTFRIGGTSISYATVANVPVDLANGSLISVRLQTAQVAGNWVATRISSSKPRADDGDAARIEGAITAFTSTTQFSVNGIAVDASHAQFDKGMVGLVLGAQVEVRGVSSNGVITATRVTVESHQEVHDRGFELHGAVTALDAVAKSFVLRGVTVSYADPAVRFDDGGAATLAVGVQLEAQGTLSADGTKLLASRIEFGK